MPPMRLTVERAVGGEKTGYGQMGLQLERALQRMGWDTGPGAESRIICAPPFSLKDKYEGERVWCFSMFESSRLPESFLEHIDAFDGIVVPNEYNLEQWGKEHSNVHLAPLGIDSEWWKPRPRTVGKEFVVRLFGRSYRKGQDIAPKMFEMAFPDADRLDPKPVFIWDKVGGKYSEEEMRQLYYDTHVCLAPSRGEGWNMLPFQALATGCPTVLSDIPGQPYSWLPGAYTIECGLSPSIIGGEDVWWAGYWWEPSVEDGARQLRWVYENYAEAHAAAQRGAPLLAGWYTWEQTAKCVIDAMQPKDAERGSTRIPLKYRKFAVNIIKPVQANIGDVVLNLDVGTHYVTADQARVLTHAGYSEMRGSWMTSWEMGRR